jgi:hypothetical protein
MVGGGFGCAGYAMGYIPSGKNAYEGKSKVVVEGRVSTVPL